jgi:archaellum biogenesis protein FlaJ (TadC family)
VNALTHFVAMTWLSSLIAVATTILVEGLLNV